MHIILFPHDFDHTVFYNCHTQCFNSICKVGVFQKFQKLLKFKGKDAK